MAVILPVVSLTFATKGFLDENLTFVPSVVITCSSKEYIVTSVVLSESPIFLVHPTSTAMAAIMIAILFMAINILKVYFVKIEFGTIVHYTDFVNLSQVV
jgi:hypothetical protein